MTFCQILRKAPKVLTLCGLFQRKSLRTARPAFLGDWIMGMVPASDYNIIESYHQFYPLQLIHTAGLITEHM